MDTLVVEILQFDALGQNVLIIKFQTKYESKQNHACPSIFNF